MYCLGANDGGLTAAGFGLVEGRGAGADHVGTGGWSVLKSKLLEVLLPPVADLDLLPRGHSPGPDGQVA